MSPAGPPSLLKLLWLTTLLVSMWMWSLLGSVCLKLRWRAGMRFAVNQVRELDKQARKLHG
jgi:hypothetical protein